MQKNIETKLLAKLRHILGPEKANRMRRTVTRFVSKVGVGESRRLPGISAIIRVRNEEWWIKPSILSISDLVNEFVICDSSTDRTPQIIDRLRREYGLRITHILSHGEDIVRHSNEALFASRFKWILRWDADFIASDTMVKRVRQLVSGLSRGNYQIFWPLIRLDLDIFHQGKQRTQSEHWLCTWVPQMKFVKIRGGYEYMYIPSWLSERIDLPDPMGFHVNVKPKEKMLGRKYWGELLRSDHESEILLDDYIIKRIEKDFGTSSIEQAAEINFQTQLRQTSRYRPEEFGDYPTVLVKYIHELTGKDLNDFSGRLDSEKGEWIGKILDH